MLTISPPAQNALPLPLRKMKKKSEIKVDFSEKDINDDSQKGLQTNICYLHHHEAYIWIIFPRFIDFLQSRPLRMKEVYVTIYYSPRVIYGTTSRTFVMKDTY